MVKDTRPFEKKADELIASGKQIVLRFLLKNKTLVEHSISIIKLKSEIKYSDKKYLYTSYSSRAPINDVYCNVRQKGIDSTLMESRLISENDKTLKPFLVTLLNQGYTVIE